MTLLISIEGSANFIDDSLKMEELIRPCTTVELFIYAKLYAERSYVAVFVFLFYNSKNERIVFVFCLFLVN